MAEGFAPAEPVFPPGTIVSRPDQRPLPPRPKVWLIGETNPYQDDPEDSIRYAMYPDPPESAGGRLCELILGMEHRDLRAFERRNLLAGPWEGRGVTERARAAAACLVWEMGPGDQVFLFGRKVFESFFPGEPWSAAPPFHTIGRSLNGGSAPYTWFWALPHPSGLNRFWNDYRSYSAVRAVVARAAPHLAPLLGRAPTTRGRMAAEREVARAG
jgi:hypothetical protein